MTMTFDELQKIFEQTLEDGRLSRAEKQALSELFEGLDLSPSARAGYLNRAFALAGDALSKMPDREVLEWLLSLSKIVARSGAQARTAEVLFEPRDDTVARLSTLIREARRSIDLCVFTVTDNRLAEALLQAHRQGVLVRMISDDDKAEDRGSDVDRLEASGIPTRRDKIPDHMHHKFAVFDGEIAVTGSYNWTRGAAERNYENLLVTDDPRLVGPYLSEFKRLWVAFEE
ncbi:MAG: phospholipase D-like domain-containing protein [Acidobacteriota bacterium]